MTDSKRSVWSWALYDWANSAFATTVMAGFFPMFFKSYWSDPNSPGESTFYLGLANSGASIIVAILAPFMGSVADRGTAKMKLLTTFAFLGVVMTAALWTIHRGHWQLAVLCYVAAAVGFAGSNIFYDSLLPAVASERNVNYVSALGFALGYIGGGLLFAANVLMYLNPGSFGLPDGETAVKLSFLTVALWWGVFTVPLLLFVKEPVIYDPVPLRRALVLGWRQLAGTLRDIRNLKVVGFFLAAYWFYIDGVDTIVRMGVDYGMSLGLPSGSLIVALLLVQFVAFPAALAYSWFAGKVGTKRAIMIGIVAYACITLLAAFMRDVRDFYGVAIGVGLFQGGVQALSRSLYTRIIPREKSAQFFGFYNMLGKFAAVIGPALLGTITVVTGNPRAGILSILLLFALGGGLLAMVDVEEGKRMAKVHLAR
ncbi:MAG: MFS transporter [Elusimicrobiota bacterium]